MGVKLLSLASLIVVGAMIADALSHGQTTSNIINTAGQVWNTSIATVAGQG